MGQRAARQLANSTEPFTPYLKQIPYNGSLGHWSSLRPLAEAAKLGINHLGTSATELPQPYLWVTRT